MNIIKESIDDLNAVLKIEVEKADYDGNVEKVLRDYRKKANIKGFRPGMVPIGLVKKMYGKAVQIDEINKVVTENIQKYITDEKIEILGDPLPKIDDNEKIDFDTQESFTFSFELGLAPSFETKLSKKNKVIYYEIASDEKMKNDYLDNYTRRYGKFEKADISEEKDILKGRIEALDDKGSTDPDGISADDTSLSIEVIKDKKIKKQFIGRTEKDTIDFDLRKAFPNDNEIAGLLKKQKEEVISISGDFRFTINEISRFRPAELNQELFDRIYGENVIHSEEEFRNRVNEEITANLRNESEYKLSLDLKKLALEKSEFQLPEAFLKRWLLKVNDKTTEEQVEKEFDNFSRDLKWQLIRNKIARANELKITEEELLKEAEKITRYQFSQYGLFYATDEQVENYAKETLKREEDAKRIADKILEEKVNLILKDTVKLENKSVSIEEFNKLFE
ncbi:MAG TPA: trigger factor [Bacteroidales bacterium]|jgi:trigger factor|nr:trigger factor [Bacteroidales bacterium]HBZ20644.1 trigger factor [Bacteroidales bacterium]